MARKWQLSDLYVLIGTVLLLVIYINEVASISDLSYNIIFDIDVFENSILLWICMMIMIYTEHRVRSEPTSSVPVQRAIDIGRIELIDVSDQFPYKTVGFSILILVIVLGIDWNFSSLVNQIYGLILDATGAYLLGRGIFRNPTVPRDIGGLNEHTYMTDQHRRHETAISDAFDGGWGVVFLLIGFVIQILSLLPWTTLL